jgi:NAD(P)-dependent dehydrogenase (short-subunit alcohol dehydrogenase family)
MHRSGLTVSSFRLLSGHRSRIGEAAAGQWGQRCGNMPFDGRQWCDAPVLWGLFMTLTVHVILAAALQDLANTHRTEGSGIWKRNVIRLYEMDVADEASVETAFEAIAEDFPALDALINSAGVSNKVALVVYDQC